LRIVNCLAIVLGFARFGYEIQW